MLESLALKKAFGRGSKRCDRRDSGQSQGADRDVDEYTYACNRCFHTYSGLN